MGMKKLTRKYYFSVEGETEQWYLKWLQDQINNMEESVCKVSIDCPVKKNPLKHAKSLTVMRKIEVYHFFDYESDDRVHVQNFQDAMDNMKKAEQLGKQIKYKIQKRGRQTMMEIALLFRIGSTVSLALLTGAVVIYKKSKKLTV